jgi:tyrosinase
VPFVVAGKFGRPSINDKDAVIEVHRRRATGPVIAKKTLMVRVRKDANKLWPSERDRFLQAMRQFRNSNQYLVFQELHRLASTAGDEAHMQPSFLPWHRAMLLHVERELQKIDPTVALHYWNWDSASPNIFTEDFMGAPGTGGFLAEPRFALSNPLNGWDTDLPFSGGELRRNTADHTRDPAGSMKPLLDMVVDWNDFGPTSENWGDVQSFSDDLERSSHNPAHGWACGSGHLTMPVRSAADPLFYLLHSQIEREWAYWQWQKNRFGTVVNGVLTFPSPSHYDNNGNWNTPGNVADWDFRQKGSFLNDGLWPWDGTTGGTNMTPEWRPLNQATSGGGNIPLSMPAVPMTPFPASARPNLWPNLATIPTNAHMIDYSGRFQPQDGLGFSYDDVPY